MAKTPTIDDMKKHFTKSLEKVMELDLSKTPAMLYYKALALALDKVQHNGKPLPDAFRRVILSSDYAELAWLGPDAEAHKMWLRSLAMLHVKAFSHILDLGEDLDEAIIAARIREIQAPVK